MWDVYLLIGALVGIVAFFVFAKPSNSNTDKHIFPWIIIIIFSVLTWPLVVFMLLLIGANEYVIYTNKKS